MKTKATVLSCMIGVALAGVSLEGQTADRTQSVDAPSVTLERALQELAKRSNLQIVFRTEYATGIPAKSVPPGLAPEKELGLLLAGTGLRYQYINANTIVIEVEDQGRAAGGKGETTAVDETNHDQGSASPQALEEVMVTARRREESLQAVPVSVTALSQDALEENHIQSVADLQYQVPSMNLSGYHRNSLFVSIRGQGGFSFGSAASVATYLNEVPIPVDSSGGTIGGPGFYHDLENVQVLKGPQGTLFGRNTTGGAVLLQTKRPTNDTGGYVKLTAGNYENKEFDTAVNLPLIDDTLLVRIAGAGQKRDGYTRSLGTPGHPNGIDLDGTEFWSARATITFKPTDGIRNDLIYSTFDSKDHGTSAILGAVRQGSNATVYFPGVNAAYQQQQSLGVRTQVPIDTNTATHVNYRGLMDIFEADLTDDLMLRNIAGYTRTESMTIYDGDGTRFPIFNYPSAIPEPPVTKQFTEELQLQGKSFDGDLTWVAGGFYLRSPAHDFSTRILTIFGQSRIDQANQGEKTKGLYAQGTYDLSSLVAGLKFTAGFRHSWDDRELYTRNLTAQGLCTPRPATANAECIIPNTGSFKAPSWTVGLDYQLYPDTLVYVASRRGYRTGGFNRNAQLPENRTFDPEYVTDVEAGLKSDWDVAGMSARTNVAIYNQEFTDIQLNTSVQEVPNGAPASVSRNAGNARITGAELEGALNPIQNLQLGLAFSWINFKYTQVQAGVTPPLQVNSPKFRYTVSARYRVPAAEALGDVELSANWSWQDQVYVAANVDPLSVQEPYGLLTLGATWSNVLSKPLDASFYMTNATDTLYAVGAFSLYNAIGTSTRVYGAPRMYGFSLRYRFGSEK